MVDGHFQMASSGRWGCGWLGCAALMALWAGSTTAWAEPTCLPLRTDASPAEMPLPSLEAQYKACDARIAHELPSLEELEYCTLVYETLKQRRFGGSTDRFVDWLRRQPKPAPPSACSRERASPHAVST